MPVVSLRPSADVSVVDWETGTGSGSNLYAEIDETTVSSTDYIATEGGTAKFELTNPSADITAATMRVRFRKDGDDEANLTIRLLQNDGGSETVVAEWEFTDIADTDVDEEVALTAPQFALITDPSDLRIEFEATTSSGPAWSPLDLAGLIGWYNFAPGNYTVSGSTILTVADLSGSGHDLEDIGGAVAYHATAFNGHPCAVFTAATDGALYNSAFATGTGLTHTCYVAGMRTSSVDAYGAAVTYAEDASNDYATTGSRALVVNEVQGEFIRFTMNSLTGGPDAMAHSTPSRFGSLARVNSNDLDLYVIVDGVKSGTPGTISGGAIGAPKPFASGGNLVVGARWLSSGIDHTGSWDGQIAEVVMCNEDIGDSDLATLDAYFATKFGL